MTDAFGTAALRAAVLEAWRASPTRLREDANTEEDHARGYYRDRVLVELAQNAADAATRAGVPGRLLIRLASTTEGPVLIAANTGAPLDAAGVASLASMRASAKREAREHAADGSTSGSAIGPTGPLVGRFGVGFAAVRAVADEITVLSTTGGVRFSVADTAELLTELSGQVPALAEEVRRRDGSLPALRLPFPAEGAPPTGYDTAVVLRLRNEVAADEVRTLLHAVGDPMLLALPGLVEIVIEDDAADPPVRRLADVGRRWRIASGEGQVELALLADRPVEERSARTWRVTWAVPRAVTASSSEAGGEPFWPPSFETPTAGPRWDPVVHAPTPTDEPCTVPALLVATLPLDPSRRHVAAGPLTDAVIDHAADVYARLAVELATDGEDPLALVPTGLAAGPLDGAVRERIVERLSRTPLLERAAAPDGGSDGGSMDGSSSGDPQTEPDLVEPRRAVAINGEVGRDSDAVRALGARVPSLIRLSAGTQAAARTLGVELRDLSDVVEELPAVHAGAPEEWRALYTALEAAAGDPAVREQLGSLPVPLADGRMVRGARGLVQLPHAVADARASVGAGGPGAGEQGAGEQGAVDALEVLARWGLRIVHPDAGHPLLVLLGAQDLDEVGLLRHSAVRQAVLDQADDDDLDVAGSVTDAVLTLVANALASTGDASGDVRAAPGTVVDQETAAWLGLLTLTAADGEPAPAHGLVLPGSLAAQLLDPRVLAPVSVETLERWGADVLVAVGVRADLLVVRVQDVLADPDLVALDGTDASTLTAQSLDGWEEYVGELARVLGPDALVPEVAAVADLDAVDPDAWGRLLARIASQPAPRAALLDPVRAEGVPGREASSFTAWWLRTRAGIDLDSPFATTGADAAVQRLLPPAPEVVRGLDTHVQRVLGGVPSFADLDTDGWAGVLAGLGPAGTPVELGLASALWRAWADLADGPEHADKPEPADGPEPGADGRERAGGQVDLVPALVDESRVAVVHAQDAAVADSPMWRQRTDLASLVPAPQGAAARLAELLDLPLASDLADGLVDEQDDDAGLVPTPVGVLALLPGAPHSWVEHDSLHVDGAPVDWWVEGHGADAVVHATQLVGLARGLAQAAGRWEARYAVEIALTEPARAAELTVEAALEL